MSLGRFKVSENGGALAQIAQHYLGIMELFCH